VVKEVVFLFYP